ncbi:MAG: FkbM family methyltransferase [Pseudomonadales bacterium]|nr:FkbM family methyltransferase [Pseudomonadales bacterium]
MPLKYKLLRILGNFISAFFRNKQTRQKIRGYFGGNAWKEIKRSARLSKCGNFSIKNVNGQKIAESDEVNLGFIFDGDSILIAEEIFRDHEYSFDINADCVVIDIGMNIGYASLYFAMMPAVLKVYGFEPFKPTYKQAIFNFSLNNSLSEKIEAFNFGLGDQEKTLDLDYYSKSPGQMSTVKSTFDIHPNRKGETILETAEIKDASSQISEIISRHANSKIVLKCDTEGSEKEIFENLHKNGILDRIDCIMLEYHFSYDKPVIEILKKNGFNYFNQHIITLDTGDFGMIRAMKSCN